MTDASYGDMGPIQIESGHLTLGAALQQYCARHIHRVVHKCCGQLIGATIHFKEEGVYFECTITLKVPHGEFVGNAKGKDTYASFNIALEKVEKQARRAKSLTRDEKPNRRADKDQFVNGPLTQRYEPDGGDYA